ncbi:hypothetical protein [Niallia sp. Man26]|uniref:hypothetical protein n=1 Tax=Niallia sp. Man26 TaxID=2912824 RepID=UPI001EDB0E87|nr:hypothetical protein [Niallia sp. Man26]UPO90268.1 hypothetical protein L8T27_019525 [Niallia sp. Man26]
MRLSYIIDLIIAMMGSMSNQRTLDTRRVDSHIEKLNQLVWFQQLFAEEKYRKLFITNYKIRQYLDSPFRVKRLENSTKTQERFLKLLNKQLAKGRKRSI